MALDYSGYLQFVTEIRHGSCCTLAKDTLIPRTSKLRHPLIAYSNRKFEGWKRQQNF